MMAVVVIVSFWLCTLHVSVVLIPGSLTHCVVSQLRTLSEQWLTIKKGQADQVHGLDEDQQAEQRLPPSGRKVLFRGWSKPLRVLEEHWSPGSLISATNDSSPFILLASIIHLRWSLSLEYSSAVEGRDADFALLWNLSDPWSWLLHSTILTQSAVAGVPIVPSLCAGALPAPTLELFTPALAASPLYHRSSISCWVNCLALSCFSAVLSHLLHISQRVSTPSSSLTSFPLSGTIMDFSYYMYFGLSI